MEEIYPFALAVHLFCAIVFVGFIFFDVVIFTPAKKRLDADTAERASEEIFKKAVKIMPFCVLGLLLSGGMMVSKWVSAELGFFDTTLQQILMLKVLFACVIFIGVALNLSAKFILKRPPFIKNLHPIALVLALGIMLCAKFMFYL